MNRDDKDDLLAQLEDLNTQWDTMASENFWSQELRDLEDKINRVQSMLDTVDQSLPHQPNRCIACGAHLLFVESTDNICYQCLTCTTP